jgi:hypothetical protein
MCLAFANIKSSHWVEDCKLPNKLDHGTASYSKAKEYPKMEIDGM